MMPGKSGPTLDLAAEDVLDALDGIAFVVDRGGRIVTHSRRAWDESCADGNAPELAEPGGVVGRPLAGFVTPGEVRSMVERQLAAVLGGSGPIVYHFRCDAPEVRREMRMSISSLGGEASPRGALFQSIVLRQVMRPPMNIFDHKALERHLAEQQDIPIVTMCAYCQRIRADAADRFVEAEDYYRAGGSSEVRVSHGVCPDCVLRLDGDGAAAA